MAVCGLCKHEIIECDTCGGKKCVPGCEDRIKFRDGCACEAAAIDAGLIEPPQS